MTNPTLGYLAQRLQGKLSTSTRVIRSQALADRSGELPAQGEMFNGQQALLMQARGPTANLPYYLPQTVLALGLAIACGIAASLCWTLAEPGPWVWPLGLTLATVAAICLWQAVARRHGPPFVDSERYAQAGTRLEDSGDIHARPMSVLMITIMTFIFTIDGALSGVTLTTEVFGSIFTPRMAAAATALWSLGTAFLLFHLTRNAAQECARNQRRVLVRNLLASPRAADHERAEAMIDAVGPVLGHDFSQGANRTRARWALALVVTLLSVTTFLVRVTGSAPLARR